MSSSEELFKLLEEIDRRAEETKNHQKITLDGGWIDEITEVRDDAKAFIKITYNTTMRHVIGLFTGKAIRSTYIPEHEPETITGDRLELIEKDSCSDGYSPSATNYYLFSIYSEQYKLMPNARLCVFIDNHDDTIYGQLICADLVKGL